MLPPIEVIRTTTVQSVLLALLRADGALYGRRLMTELGLKSGTLYPLLARMEAAGWLVSREEKGDPSYLKRPVRRYWGLTEEGEELALRERKRLRALIAK